jgi:hypothetical protein
MSLLAFFALFKLLLLPHIVILSKLLLEEVRVLVILFLNFPTLLRDLCNLQFVVGLIHADVLMTELHEDLYTDIELSFGKAGCINFLGLRRVIKYFNEPDTY